MTHAQPVQLLLIVDDNPVALNICRTVLQTFPAVKLSLSDLNRDTVAGAQVAIVCLGHDNLKRYCAMSGGLGIPGVEDIFLLPTHNQASQQILKDRGVANYLTAPVPDLILLLRIKEAFSRAAEASWEILPAPQGEAMTLSRKSITACFDAAKNGYPLDIEDIETTCDYLAEASTDTDLLSWMVTIKSHHDYTYRHSMLVSTTLVHFGKAMGVSGEDLQFLAIGGILHDVGKSMVPYAILEKPAKLDDDEFAQMRRHPSFSRDVLLRESGLDPRIMDMAVHHHEKLDGTGYPDGLKGTQISDFVRLMSIADVFSALVDERSYKAAMSAEAAFEMMMTFDGHLDLELVAAYQAFVLDMMSAEPTSQIF